MHSINKMSWTMDSAKAGEDRVLIERERKGSQTHDTNSFGVFPRNTGKSRLCVCQHRVVGSADRAEDISGSQKLSE